MLNTGRINQEKRTIKVKDFLEDFRSGMVDDELLVKYHLTQVGLEKFYTMLLDRGILDNAELEEHYERERALEDKSSCADLENSSYICPCCLSSQDAMFDICPNCGVSFQELISREKEEADQAVQAAAEAEQLLQPRVEEPPKAECREEAIPEAGIIEEVKRAKPASEESAKEDDFMFPAEDLPKKAGGFEDSLDEIKPGMSLNFLDECAEEHEEHKAHESSGTKCDGCSGRLLEGFRDVYDRSRSRQALTVAAVCLVIGFVGTMSLSMFEGYSPVRLVVFFFTSVSLLLGGVLAAIGAFMMLAREKVYHCVSCSRVFPRV